MSWSQDSRLRRAAAFDGGYEKREDQDSKNNISQGVHAARNRNSLPVSHRVDCCNQAISLTTQSLLNGNGVGRVSGIISNPEALVCRSRNLLHNPDGAGDDICHHKQMMISTGVFSSAAG